MLHDDISPCKPVKGNSKDRRQGESAETSGEAGRWKNDKQEKEKEGIVKGEGKIRRRESEEEKVIKINKGTGNEEQMDGRVGNQ